MCVRVKFTFHAWVIVITGLQKGFPTTRLTSRCYYVVRVIYGLVLLTFFSRPTPQRIFKYPHFSNARDETLSKEAFVTQCGKREHEHFLSFLIPLNQRKSPPSATLVSKEGRTNRFFPITNVRCFSTEFLRVAGSGLVGCGESIIKDG